MLFIVSINIYYLALMPLAEQFFYLLLNIVP